MKKIICLLCFISFAYKLNPVGFNLSNKTVTLKVSSGANLKLNSPITNVNGTIIKESGANIDGSSITFNDGSFNDSTGKVKVLGTLDFGDIKKIILDGNKNFEGKRGDVLQAINISGQDNIVQGVLSVLDDIELQDINSSVLFNIRTRLDSNINLNSGSMILGDDLAFLDTKRIFGPGSVDLAGHRLSLGAKDLTWDEPILFKDASDIKLNSNLYLNSTWTFSGSSILCGGDKIIFLNTDNCIRVLANSHLLIRDAVLYGLSGSNISCIDDSSVISLQNVKIILDNNFNFTSGALIFWDTVEFIGKNKTFNYQTNMTSTIKDNAIIVLGNTVTFSYAPSSGKNNLLEFEADDSTINLNGGTIYTAYTGLDLLKGRIVVDKNSNLIIESKNWLYESVTSTYNNLDDAITYTTYDYTYGISGYLNLGNDVQEYDFKVDILNGANLKIYSGILSCNNTLDSCICTNDSMSCLSFMAGSHFDVCHDLNIGSGQIVLYGGAGLRTFNNAIISGSISRHN
ncbi:MAG: hypothetical protein SZ59_C0004G0097 [candidate division TM6 bacterium GW2011_GWF2_28_16]|nr:MAG: hypothetical protein SZ59_C0004G0097 [candidate division TM6 bacterium GW2011_GWF2_28_16]